jgi:hypothetical protein
MASGEPSKKIHKQSGKKNENSDDSTDEISINVEQNQHQKSSEYFPNKPLSHNVKHTLNKKNNLIFSDNEEDNDQNFSDDFSEVETHPPVNKKNYVNNNSIHNANYQKNYVNNKVTEIKPPIRKKPNQHIRDTTPASVFTIEESIASPPQAQKDKLRMARDIRRPSPDLDSVAL